MTFQQSNSTCSMECCEIMKDIHILVFNREQSNILINTKLWALQLVKQIEKRKLTSTQGSYSLQITDI